MTAAHLELIGISSLRTIRMMTGIMEDIIESGTLDQGDAVMIQRPKPPVSKRRTRRKPAARNIREYSVSV